MSPRVLIDDFLETQNIQGMSWPANFPDLNPIEHVWDMLGRQIAALSHPPSSVTELKRTPRSLEPFEPTTHSSSHSKYVVRNKTETGILYSSSQRAPSDFIHDLLNIPKRLRLNMSEEGLWWVCSTRTSVDGIR
ncbi:transposable element Tcb2 transposase [Trichonephila clavipes]|nr:transposable element Tcb2 transposase [Trichonephila clavipes]